MRPRSIPTSLIWIPIVFCAIGIVSGCASSSRPASLPLSEAELLEEARYRTAAFLRDCTAGCGVSLDPSSGVDSVYFAADRREMVVEFNAAFAQIPFRPDNVKAITRLITRSLGPEFAATDIRLTVDGIPLPELIPNVYRAAESVDQSRRPSEVRENRSHVRNISRPFSPQTGLQNRHVAIWPSHGWYYESSENRWEWQRARLFQSVEDLLPMSFISPYLAPMLERAGARVYLPRERDPQFLEAIVDNDDPSGDLTDGVIQTVQRQNAGYFESDHLAPDFREWTTGLTTGYASGSGLLRGSENPFEAGTYRMIRADSISSASAAWVPDIPDVGEYSVYVSYARLPNAAPDARYTVYHQGGETTFLVDQTMGGGTWTYLGTFKFARGTNPEAGMVTLENESKFPGRVISGDGVRFGGGMGNVVRGTQSSGRPRYTEGARYYMQFSGMPDTLVYNVTETLNDYVDDYRSRAEWVNYLRGAPLGPNKDRSNAGLSIPLDVSLAFHTDAGIAPGNETIGTLMIYSTAGYDAESKFPDGMSRLANRDLGDMMQTQIVDDVRILYDSTWSRRSIWDRDYSEAVRPNVPGVLLELLSHQNFADMKFALDPSFRFDVGRAIYKSLLRFIAAQDESSYVVEPLSVTHLAIQSTGENAITLSWEPRSDPLEESADPTGYVVYRRIGSAGFDNGTYTTGKSFQIEEPAPGVVYSFRVAAVNDGGESAPSEVVSMGVPEPSIARRSRRGSGLSTVLVINGFDRLAPPGIIDEGTRRGFSELVDEGVADGWDVSFVGNQHDYDAKSPFIDDDAPGHGASYATHETVPRVGNTFDYAATHGEAILESGAAFYTASNEAVADGRVDMHRFDIVDVILGEQRTTRLAGNRRGPEFQTFTSDLQQVLRDFTAKGGRLFVSGAYVGTDLHADYASEDDRAFARGVLHIKFQTNHASETGRLVSPESNLLPEQTELAYNISAASDIYRVESPDAILPSSSNGEVLLRYQDSNISAAVGHKGKGGTVVFGFPFETVLDAQTRSLLMTKILDYLSE